MSGKLYGVGVGPGDPELLTLKAVRIINESNILAIPVSNLEYAKSILDLNTQRTLEEIPYENSCVSYKIASNIIGDLDKKELLYLPMPMTKDKELLKACHNYGVSLIKDRLDQNQIISFLTLGDPSVYSTYLYIHKRAIALGYNAEIISGVPSFCAVAARLNIGLVENAEELHIIPASYQIEESLSLKGTKVLMKTGRNVEKVKKLLSERAYNNVSDSSIPFSVQIVENCGMDHEAVYQSIDEVGDSLSYYSMIVVKEN